MRQYIDTLQDVQGNALVGATVLVQNYIGGANASIFSDNGLTPISTSTVSTGADGQFSFFAADGDYTLVLSKNSTVFKTQSPVSLFDGTPQITYADTGGGANVYAVSNAALEKALRTGLRASFKAANTNTFSSSFQYNGLAAKVLVFPGGANITASTIIAGGIYQVEYDGTNWQLRNGLQPVPYYGQTTAEANVGVTPNNTSINPNTLDPQRYGAVGNGTTDDTAALNTWVLVVNATTNPVSTWSGGYTYLCGPLNAITAANFTWNFGNILVKPNSWGAGPTTHVTVTATGFRANGLKINGNQASWAGAIAGFLFVQGAGDFIHDQCTFINSPSEGFMADTQTIGRLSNCHFDSNAYAGLDMRACSWIDIVNCTINFNGYGFQKTYATNAFQAFGLVQRFRNHHITFTNCQAQANGRDGMNCDQGTYAIKFIGCKSWNNGDGGFTITCDQQSTGRLGDGEPCYDLEYIDCESWDNWSSGLAAYTVASPACYNVTVDGGRYYNNNRLAGTQASASSYISGIYFGGGSLGIRVRAKCYDDRQYVPVTAAAAGVVTATGWVPGTMANYPRVALYNASLAFQGYGNITAESAGSVTITTTASNGVTLANIAAGWFITQRVQHNGLFFDNNCQGLAAVDGFGFSPGALGPTLSGFKVISGFTAGGQNILLPESTYDYTELMANATFDAGTSSGTAWNYSTPGTGGASNYYTTAGSNLRSPGCLQLIGGAGNNATAQATLITSGLAYAQGCFVELSFWCSAVNAGDAQLILFYNGGTGQQYTVVNHPGGGYKQLRIGIYCPAGTTQVTPELQAAAGKTTYWDTGLLRVKQDSYDNRDYSYPTRNLAI